MTDRVITSPGGEAFPFDDKPEPIGHNPLALGAWERKQHASVRTANARGAIVDYLRGTHHDDTRPTHLAEPLTVFSALNPDGKLVSNGENVSRTHHLRDELARLGFEPSFVTLFERGTEHWTRDWYEPAVAVATAELTTVQRAVVVRAFGQVGCVVISGATLRYEAPFSAALSLDAPCVATPVAERPCPMPHQRVDDDGRCINVGGPWVSSSQRAAVLWSWGRDWMLGLYGCDRCSLDKTPTPVRTGGTAPTSAAVARRRLLNDDYAIVVADGAQGRTSNATVGDVRTGSALHVESGFESEPLHRSDG